MAGKCQATLAFWGLQGCIGCCLKVGLAHRFLSIGEFLRTPVPEACNGLNLGLGKSCSDGKRGLSLTACLLLLLGCFVEQDYSLFTAADAKIALSMGPVNRKPQYVVFRW